MMSLYCFLSKGSCILHRDWKLLPRIVCSGCCFRHHPISARMRKKLLQTNFWTTHSFELGNCLRPYRWTSVQVKWIILSSKELSFNKSNFKFFNCLLLLFSCLFATDKTHCTGVEVQNYPLEKKAYSLEWDCYLKLQHYPQTSVTLWDCVNKPEL